MKNIYFLCGMPRAGNTLLGSLINQNPKLNITANTILADVIYQIKLCKELLIFKNFPDHESLDNIISNTFKNYYEKWEADNIIDRGPWGTPGNLKSIKNIFKKPKFIILYRPVLESLASFIRIEKPKNIHSSCEALMDLNGIIGKNLWSIKNIIAEKEDFILINYKDLINNTEEQLVKIYKFLNINFFNHKLNKLNQFEVNNILYNDSVIVAPLHDIKTDKIELNSYNITDYLPPEIINKYSNLDI
jgi:hypothetical protein